MISCRWWASLGMRRLGVGGGRAGLAGRGVGERAWCWVRLASLVLGRDVDRDSQWLRGWWCWECTLG